MSTALAWMLGLVATVSIYSIGYRHGKESQRHLFSSILYWLNAIDFGTSHDKYYAENIRISALKGLGTDDSSAA